MLELFPNVELTLQADSELHNFNMNEFLSDLGVSDVYDAIKAVNAVRKEVIGGW